METDKKIITENNTKPDDKTGTDTPPDTSISEGTNANTKAAAGTNNELPGDAGNDKQKVDGSEQSDTEQSAGTGNEGTGIFPEDETEPGSKDFELNNKMMKKNKPFEPLEHKERMTKDEWNNKLSEMEKREKEIQDALDKELETISVSERLIALAGKIASGNTQLNEQDLADQETYPEQLETLLQKIKAAEPEPKTETAAETKTEPVKAEEVAKTGKEELPKTTHKFIVNPGMILIAVGLLILFVGGIIIYQNSQKA